MAMWTCRNCGETVDEPYKPNYRCPRCGAEDWE